MCQGQLFKAIPNTVCDVNVLRGWRERKREFVFAFCEKSLILIRLSWGLVRRPKLDTSARFGMQTLNTDVCQGFLFLFCLYSCCGEIEPGNVIRLVTWVYKESVHSIPCTEDDVSRKYGYNLQKTTRSLKDLEATNPATLVTIYITFFNPRSR